MATKVIMPQMGESIFEGTITKWLKKVGDRINRDEPLFEISTDKVDSEIPSPASGILTEILVPEGQTVQINTVVALIDGEAEKRAAATAEEARGPRPEPPAERAAELSVKAQEEPPAAPRPAPRAQTSPARPPQEIRASPLVRRLAREHDVDLSALQGTGLGGRITKEDILGYIERRTETREAPAPAAAAAAPERSAAAPSVTPEAPRAAPAAEVGVTETVPMTPMRKAIAEHMVSSRRTSAHVSTVFEVDMGAVLAARDKYKERFEQREGVRLTVTPFIAKGLVNAVREFPICNASVSGDNIVYKRPINLGVAVALESGLIVPVVKDAHLKSLTGLALAIADLAERARTRRLRPDEVVNGTITITNPGVYGALFGTPIINQPQVAILGVGGIEKRPVVINDAIAIRSMVYLSLSFDHRIIDGAVADQFMARLKGILQAWSEAID